MMWVQKKVEHFQYLYEVHIPFQRIGTRMKEIEQWSQENGIPYKVEYQAEIGDGMFKHLDEDEQEQLRKLLIRIPNYFTPPSPHLLASRVAIWGLPSNVNFRFQDNKEAVQFKLVFG